jgi:hypothetical protein
MFRRDVLPAPEEMDVIKDKCREIIYSFLSPLYQGQMNEKKTE